MQLGEPIHTLEALGWLLAAAAGASLLLAIAYAWAERRFIDVRTFTGETS